MGNDMNVMQGIKVVDVTSWAFVPSAGGILAHWGADVIKVESPAAPDPMRTFAGTGTLDPGQSSNMFKHYSRGKRSVGINLAAGEGRDLVYKLAAVADVFLTSYLPATRKKLKIDVDDIRAVNPKIIYARGSGQGPKGPEAGRPGYDGITWWARGSLSQSAMDSSGSEWPIGMIGHGDGMSGMTLAGGICAGLLQRERTGIAPVVDGSLMGTAVWFNGPAIIAAQFDATDYWKPNRQFRPATPPASREKQAATRAMYQTMDYRFLNLMFLGDDDRDYADLCKHVGRPELGTDVRFATAGSRQANSRELLAIFEEIFAGRTLDQWKEALVTARGAWSAIQTPEEIYDDPQAIANGFLRTVEYPGGGLKLPVPPVLFDEEAGDPPAAPDFAQDTDAVLNEIGCSAEEIGRLRAAGVVV
ncbi:MAG: CaiB/BaiF CoA transferase family protein [Acidimicrobiales bacterium]